MGQELDAFRWTNRLLLLFPNEKGDPAYVQALASLKASRSALSERDLLILTPFIEKGALKPAASQSFKEGDLLRETYRIPETGFHWVLIGKDGSEKERGMDSFPLDKIFDRIDRMPMRRAEMRRKKDQGG